MLAKPSFRQTKFAVLVLGASLLQSTLSGADPAATARSLCDALTAAMKQGTALNFSARRGQLAPEIEKDFDLALMTRLVVGPTWRTFSADDRSALQKAFADYSIATYAQRFKSYDGERFEVDPTPSPVANGSQVVHTKLYTGGPDWVQLDYLERAEAGQWKIMDVFLSGSISELAARRSEYATTLRSGGPRALIALLQAKTSELSQ